MNKTAKILVHIIGPALFIAFGSYLTMPKDAKEDLKDMLMKVKNKSCICNE